MATTLFWGKNESYIPCLPDKTHHIWKFGGIRRDAMSNPLWWLCRETLKISWGCLSVFHDFSKLFESTKRLDKGHCVTETGRKLNCPVKTGCLFCFLSFYPLSLYFVKTSSDFMFVPISNYCNSFGWSSSSWCISFFDVKHYAGIWYWLNRRGTEGGNDNF